MNFETDKIQVKRRGHLAEIVLNRPEVHNALDAETIAALTHAFRHLAGEVRGILLKGAGRSFCAGADLAYMEASRDFREEENLEDARQLATLFHEIRTFPGIVVTVVHGATYGGGVGLVAASDLVLATTRARFCLSEVKLGLVPAVISPFLISRMGEGRCRALVLTGTRIRAEEAQLRGLVDRLVEPEGLEEALHELEVELAATAPEALRETKALFHRLDAKMVRDVLDETARTIARIRVGKEAQEGLQAFLEKRDPGWKTSLPES